MSQRAKEQMRNSYSYRSSYTAKSTFDEAHYDQQPHVQQLNSPTSPKLDRHFSAYSDPYSDKPSIPSRYSTGQVSTVAGEMDDSTPLSTLMSKVEDREAKQAAQAEFDPEQPTISKTDWQPGESRKEYYYKRDQRRARAATAVGRARNKCSDVWSDYWRLILLGFTILCVVLAIILAFTIPRVPTLSFGSSTPLTSSDESPYVSSSDPTEFYWYGNFSLAINAHSSFVPVKYTQFHVSVRDYQTGVVIGSGNKTMTVHGRKTTNVAVPVYFFGTFDDDSDQTYLDMRDSCVHLWTGTTRPTMNLTMVVTTKILGRTGTYTSSRLVATNLTCPIQFASNAS